MTTEELIQAFPECEKIKREDIAECITKAKTPEKPDWKAQKHKLVK